MEVRTFEARGLHVHHARHERVERHARGPTELAFRLGRISTQLVYFRGTEVSGVDRDDRLAVRCILPDLVRTPPFPHDGDPHAAECPFGAFAYAVVLASGKHVVVRHRTLDRKSTRLNSSHMSI